MPRPKNPNPTARDLRKAEYQRVQHLKRKGLEFSSRAYGAAETETKTKPDDPTLTVAADLQALLDDAKANGKVMLIDMRNMTAAIYEEYRAKFGK